MQPLREASSDPVAAFERAADAMGRARAAVRAALPMDRAAADLAMATMIAGGSALVRGELIQRRALMSGLGAAFGVEPALVRCSGAMVPEELIETRAARLSSGAAMLRPAFSHSLALVERLAEATPQVRDLVFAAAGDDRVPGWRRPSPFALLVTQPNTALEAQEIDRLLCRIDLKSTTPGPFARAVSTRDLLSAQAVAADLPIGERVLQAALALVSRARPGYPDAPAAIAEAALGAPSPRAGRALLRLMRARALADGRLTPDLDDVRALALPVLEARMPWREGADSRAALRALIETLG